jgi:hypothetical protein
MKCVLCGKETTGSTGKAGIRWKNICQSCKDREDEALEKSLKAVKFFVNCVINSYHKKEV